MPAKQKQTKILTTKKPYSDMTNIYKYMCACLFLCVQKWVDRKTNN